MNVETSHSLPLSLSSLAFFSKIRSKKERERERERRKRKERRRKKIQVQGLKTCFSPLPHHFNN